MRKLEIIDAAPEEMALIMRHGADGLDGFVAVSNQIFSNAALRDTPPNGYSRSEWKNKWGDELDGFF